MRPAVALVALTLLGIAAVQAELAPNAGCARLSVAAAAAAPDAWALPTNVRVLLLLLLQH